MVGGFAARNSDMAVTACRDREFKNAGPLDELIATELFPIYR